MSRVLHKVAQKWIDELRAKIDEGAGPTAVANLLVQIGVEGEDVCSCAESLSLEEMETLVFDLESEETILEWLHQNHRLFNTAVHEMLSANYDFQKIRRVLRTDMAREEQLIISRPYAAMLLEYFLRAEPEPTYWTTAWGV